MIAYACQASRLEDQADFERWCLPGLNRVLAPGDCVKRFQASSIHQGYNEALDWARTLPDLEALVLLHADLELLDEYFPRRVRNLFKREPDAAVIGACGARRVFGLEWWVRNCYGGVLHEDPKDFVYWSKGDNEVEMVDGCVLVLSPWAVQNLRFDPKTYWEAPWYAYDGDICFEARYHGKKVFVMDTRARHHTRGGVDTRVFALAEAAFLQKWAYRAPRDGRQAWGHGWFLPPKEIDPCPPA